MPRIYKGARGINQGERIPLSAFNEAITVLRVTATPSQEDESWLRAAIRVGNYMSAYERGEIKLVAGEKQNDKELFLFVVHGDIDHEFTLEDYVIRGTEIFHVQGYNWVGGRRGYMQINTRPWGHVKDDDFILSLTADNIVEVAPGDTLTEDGQVIEGLNGGDIAPNLFWDNPP